MRQSKYVHRSRHLASCRRDRDASEFVALKFGRVWYLATSYWSKADIGAHGLHVGVLPVADVGQPTLLRAMKLLEYAELTC